LKRLLYTPPKLKITFTLDNGETISFKAVKPIVEGGVVLNKFIENDLEFNLLMLSNGVLNTSVKKVRLEEDSLDRGFIKNFKIVNTFYDFGKKSSQQRTSDSLRILTMLDKYNPVEIAPQIPGPEESRYYVENVSVRSQIFRVAGWAFLEGSDNSKMVTKVILRSRERTLELPTVQGAREDLPLIFGKPDIGNAGFVAIVNRSMVPPGAYEVGLTITEPTSGNKVINYTDQYLRVNNPFEVEKIDSSPIGFTDQNTRANLDLVEETDDHVKVGGWAIAENENTRNSSTYLILQGKEGTFRIMAERRRRKDLTATFKNDLFEYGGLFVEIPKSKLPKGTYKIGIEKQYGENQRGFVWTKENIKFGYPVAFTPVSLTSLPPAQDFPVGVDLFQDSNDLVTVGGWAVQEMHSVHESLVKIVLKSDDHIYVSDTEPTLRPDVTAHFNSKSNLDNSGFTAKIRKSILKKGNYQLGILVSTNGNAGTIKFTDKVVKK
jgi:hypothetical protein